MGDAQNWSDGPFFKDVTPETQLELYETTKRILSSYQGIPAEDLAMDAMIRASTTNFEVRGDPLDCRRGYLYVIARRLAADYVNKSPTATLRQKNGAFVFLDELTDEHDFERLSTEPDVERNAMLHETRRVLEEAIDKVYPSMQLPLRLYYFEGKSHPEITASTGMPEGSVCTRIMRGLQQLHNVLEEDGHTFQDLLPPDTPKH